MGLPVAVVDVKKAFHEFGLAAMLEHVPPQLLQGMAQKDQIDFDAFHSKNQRALPLPMCTSAASYAVDDMHRIEAIVRYKAPPSGSYVAARDASCIMISNIKADPCGARSFQEEFDRFEKFTGARRLVKAVELMRHIVSLRARKLEPGLLPDFARIESCAAAELENAGIVIPDDLAFAG